MFGESAVVPIRTGDEHIPRELCFPVALVEMGDWFVDTMHQLAREIERPGGDPEAWLQSDPTLSKEHDLIHTARQLSELHHEGRNHIWAYYARNLVRPIALGQRKVDVIVGNPPWINYNQTDGIVRDRMKELSRAYGIWSGGRYATHQDIAGLFYTRCAHLYLNDGGQMGFVLPHSALQTGQWSAWRRGNWTDTASGRTIQMDLAWKLPWDLEGLVPNDFFPVASCVMFGSVGEKASFAIAAERWRGPAGGQMSRDERRQLYDTSGEMASPYGDRFRNGATLFPRCLLFVEPGQGSSKIRPPGTEVTNPRRGTFDKKPWKNLPLTSFHEMTVESEHVFDIHLGETLAPYVTLNPLKAVLPLRKTSLHIALKSDALGGIDPYPLGERVRDRWRTMARLWDENKKPNDGKSLVEQIDFFGKLGAQLERMRSEETGLRVAYAASGRPTAAILPDPIAIADHKLFWIPCESLDEANYLIAVINSEALYLAVSGLMPVGQFGPRALHKHLWRLPIPRFDAANHLHWEISAAGASASNGAETALQELRQSRGAVSVTIARREIRKWLASSTEGQLVESLIDKLLISANA